MAKNIHGIWIEDMSPVKWTDEMNNVAGAILNIRPTRENWKWGWDNFPRLIIRLHDWDYEFGVQEYAYGKIYS